MQTVDGRALLSAAARQSLRRCRAARCAMTGMCVVMLAFAARAAETRAPGVLIIHSNQRPTPAAIVIEETLRKVVPEGFNAPVELSSEYLDIEWSSATAEYRAEQAWFLGRKYSARNIRAIVAVAPDAIRFATEFRDRMLPGVPVVHVALPRDLVEQMAATGDFAGKTVDLDPAPTLDLALRLHPGTRRLVVVLGAAERDRVWEGRVRAAVGKLGEGVDVEYLKGLPTADLLRRLAALPRDAVVFTPGYFSDGTGAVIVPRQSVERIAQASAAPVYGALDTFVGTGIVGGYMTPYEQQAREAGAVVVRLLNGTSPAEIAPASVARVAMIDWRQMRRWHIDERLLPADAHVMFREPTAWDRYWGEISIGVAILILQAVLIAALLLERRSRRRTAHALAESQEQMNMAARAARLSFWVWDGARDRVRAITHTRQLDSARGGRAIALREFLETVHPADREDVDRAVGNALATGEELDVQYRLMGSNGDVRWMAARGRLEKGNARRLVGVALDVTDRRSAELRAAEDRMTLRHMTRVSMVGQLSAAIAHQLNQPLAAILGNAEAAEKMLARNNVDLAELREICGDIVSEDQRAAEIIRRLGELYKRGDMKVEAIDLNALIRETLDLLRTELLIRRVAPITQLAPELPRVDGGYVQLQQVVLNLVLNAADALSAVAFDERTLRIHTEVADGAVRLYVVDNGSGIAANDVNDVFDPFWSTKPGGMGIGLAICRSIVTAHHGGISAANNAEGGATFCVTLPIRYDA
jgi:C4-dicarboxylate-specific signal transduction histidine kinase